jgi:hypothetical protein
MAPKSNVICSRCAQVFKPDYTVGDRGLTLTTEWKTEKRPSKKADILVHHDSYAAFETSAREYCHLCLLFWNQVPDDKRIILRQYNIEGRIAIYVPESQVDSSHLYDIILHYSYPPQARREEAGMGLKMTLHMMSTISEWNHIE